MQKKLGGEGRSPFSLSPWGEGGVRGPSIASVKQAESLAFPGGQSQIDLRRPALHERERVLLPGRSGGF